MLFYEASQAHLIPFTFINDAEAFQLQMGIELGSPLSRERTIPHLKTLCFPDIN